MGAMTTSHALELESALLRPPLSQSERPAAATEADSFDRLVAAEYGYVARLVGRLLGWRRDTDDLVQDVFVSALAAWPRFRGECAVRTWLARIAVNKCRSHNRRRWLRERLFAAWRARQELAAACESPPADSSESMDRVRQAVDRLAQRDREVIVLHYLEQMTVTEIAGVLHISRNAVEVRLSRARKRLKLALAPYGDK
jgi:RNA polymerase sigma-70 factor (ECF subfamily)